jgi:hypothetical protein
LVHRGSFWHQTLGRKVATRQIRQYRAPTTSYPLRHIEGIEVIDNPVGTTFCNESRRGLQGPFQYGFPIGVHSTTADGAMGDALDQLREFDSELLTELREECAVVGITVSELNFGRLCATLEAEGEIETADYAA